MLVRALGASANIIAKSVPKAVLTVLAHHD